MAIDPRSGTGVVNGYQIGPGANLIGANLEKADLRGADLRGARLEGAKLRDARLYNATLFGANLNGARLMGAKLMEADLRLAGLRSANLSNAILTEADLGAADLTGANLQNADLTKADLRATRLSRADLRGADIRNAIMTGVSLDGARVDPEHVPLIRHFYEFTLASLRVAGPAGERVVVPFNLDVLNYTPPTRADAYGAYYAVGVEAAEAPSGGGPSGGDRLIVGGPRHRTFATKQQIAPSDTGLGGLGGLGGYGFPTLEEAIVRLPRDERQAFLAQHPELAQHEEIDLGYDEEDDDGRTPNPYGYNYEGDPYDDDAGGFGYGRVMNPGHRHHRRGYGR